jgi:hypothetical protein
LSLLPTWVSQHFGSKAVNVVPDSVTIEPVNENSVKISWRTDDKTIGAVKYGTSEGALNFYAPETIKDVAIDHMVELTLLTPGQLYYFEIQIGDQTYMNGAVPWTFTTSGKATGAGVTPTANPTGVLQVTLKPQRVTVPNSSSSQACSETDCEKIKASCQAAA